MSLASVVESFNPQRENRAAFWLVSDPVYPKHYPPIADEGVFARHSPRRNARRKLNTRALQNRAPRREGEIWPVFGLKLHSSQAVSALPTLAYLAERRGGCDYG